MNRSIPAQSDLSLQTSPHGPSLRGILPFLSLCLSLVFLSCSLIEGPLKPGIYSADEWPDFVFEVPKLGSEGSLRGLEASRILDSTQELVFPYKRTKDGFSLRMESSGTDGPQLEARIAKNMREFTLLSEQNTGSPFQSIFRWKAPNRSAYAKKYNSSLAASPQATAIPGPWYEASWYVESLDLEPVSELGMSLYLLLGQPSWDLSEDAPLELLYVEESLSVIRSEEDDSFILSLRSAADGGESAQVIGVLRPEGEAKDRMVASAPLSNRRLFTLTKYPGSDMPPSVFSLDGSLITFGPDGSVYQGEQQLGAWRINGSYLAWADEGFETGTSSCSYFRVVWDEEGGMPLRLDSVWEGPSLIFDSPVEMYLGPQGYEEGPYGGEGDGYGGEGDGYGGPPPGWDGDSGGPQGYEGGGDEGYGGASDEGGL